MLKNLTSLLQMLRTLALNMLKWLLILVTKTQKNQDILLLKTENIIIK